MKFENSDTVDDEMFCIFFVMLRKVASIVLARWRFQDDDTSVIHAADVDIFCPTTESFSTVLHHRSEADDPFRFIPARTR